MATTTPPNSPPITPRKTPKRTEADTEKRQRFFTIFDENQGQEEWESICLRSKVTRQTGGRWLKERALGKLNGARRTRKESVRLGRKSKVTKEMCKTLVDPAQNHIRDQHLEAQIKEFKIPVKVRQLQRKLKEHTNGAQKYKQAYTQKKISPKNYDTRYNYGAAHKNKDFVSHWTHIVYTDECHIDPSALAQGHILRERGTRTDPENIQERGELKGVRLHIAAWISWYGKAAELTFYNDEEDFEIKPKRPRKPRRSKKKSKEQYQEEIKHWEAALSHAKDVRPQGNSMTQEYYTDHILPLYCNAVNTLRTQEAHGRADGWCDSCGDGKPTGNGGSIASSWFLQEDGDPSHGMRSNGLARQYKNSNWVVNLNHPAQSPDLNPIEGVWLILKMRVRQRVWRSIAELKAICQEEWSKITMEEVRARIAEMPARCHSLVKTGGKPIKSDLW
jgi:hypothetical protein